MYYSLGGRNRKRHAGRDRYCNWHEKRNTQTWHLWLSAPFTSTLLWMVLLERPRLEAGWWHVCKCSFDHSTTDTSLAIIYSWAWGRHGPTEETRSQRCDSAYSRDELWHHVSERASARACARAHTSHRHAPCGCRSWWKTTMSWGSLRFSARVWTSCPVSLLAIKTAALSLSVQ